MDNLLELDKSLIGIGISLGVSFFILLNRKKKWMREKVVWLICSGLFVFGVSGFLFAKLVYRGDKVLYFGFCIPLIYWVFDRLFKKISENLQGRDFYLFLRGSSEINDSIFAENPHVKNSDKTFSILLLAIIVGTLFIGLNLIN